MLKSLNPIQAVKITSRAPLKQSLSNRCHPGYEDTIAGIIHNHLEVNFHKMLKIKYQADDDAGLKRTALILSWGIYGALAEWHKMRENISSEEYIKSALPYMLGRYLSQ